MHVDLTRQISAWREDLEPQSDGPSNAGQFAFLPNQPKHAR